MNYLQASPTEFRYRYWVHAAVFGLGFWSPWSIGPTTRQSAWLTLGSLIARNSTVSFTIATVALLLAGILCATAAASLRTWGTACLGSFTVTDARMQAGTIVAEGPYRYVRNPLYLGTWLHSLALALLMPPTGAVFTILATAILQARLIAGEEPFLTASLGPAYAAYCTAVPRILPSFVPLTHTAGARPQWLQAIVTESYMIGVAVAFLTLGWRYNAFLLTQCVVVCLGLSLVVRALPAPRTTGREKPASNPRI
jgi:protein-S-isoprenylcysteine O-methyltransferase Ste14